MVGLSMRELRWEGAEPDFSTTPLQLDKDPWWVFVCSVLLNRAARRQAETSARALFELFPRRQCFADSEFATVEACCRPCGLQSRRAKAIRRAARDWLSVEDLNDLWAVGPYVSDAVGLFCLGRTDLESADKALTDYVRLKKEDSQKAGVALGARLHVASGHAPRER